mmetsp:Transcript_38745/g.70346  ORF Transcript_38745/g.70346 Transcript_38745/m.70346 type:complete len:282 (+) Transcript_38745:178-1023(+)|eukprot:CAMPEP_0115159732 /NCGR_PEP_ID=MMETSP0227-20121206/70408_1 /TAXON_ID=89957 /ORGANISM="Polarella glacialis, Strain CCMP 1383" /LENGTH=281 /DNA_ID=CAMNT_0002571541 /DNA_START=1 /DNA_END=846 /DNA_ORIENTATION=-
MMAPTSAMTAAARRAPLAPLAGSRRARHLQRAAPTVVLALGLGSWLAQSFIGSSGAPGSAESQRGVRTARAFFGNPFGSPQGSRSPISDAPGRDAKHFVTGNAMYPPWPAGMEEAMFGMGCFWCSENVFMKLPGVYSSQVGYAGGDIENPTYGDVCTGASKHNEVVRVVYDPQMVSYAELLKVFWEKHNPTTLNQQGGDRGTQYRSGVYYYSEAQRGLAEETKGRFETAIGGRQICTEIVPAPTFYYAEDSHQQYDAKPGSRYYCGLSPLGAKLDISGLAD